MNHGKVTLCNWHIWTSVIKLWSHPAYSEKQQVMFWQKQVVLFISRAHLGSLVTKWQDSDNTICQEGCYEKIISACVQTNMSLMSYTHSRRIYLFHPVSNLKSICNLTARDLKSQKCVCVCSRVHSYSSVWSRSRASEQKYKHHWPHQWRTSWLSGRVRLTSDSTLPCV